MSSQVTIGEEDWTLLNAYADGELEAAETAELRQRLKREPELAHELARIRAAKAALSGLRPQSIQQDEPEMLLPQKKGRNPVWSIAASLTLVIAIGFAVYSFTMVEAPKLAEAPANPSTSDVTEAETALSLPARLGGISAPDLAASNLVLIEMGIRGETGGDRVTMNYRGPNGCRVVLTARPPTAAPLAATADLQARWQTHRARYLLTADGMDRARFAAIADYAEAQVRAQDQEALRLALVETTAKAAPCA